MGTYCCHTEINQYNFQCAGEALTPKVINITKNDLCKLDKKGGPPRIIPVYFLALMFTILIFLPDRVIASEFNPTNLYADISESIVAVIGWDSKKKRKSFGTGSIINKNGLVLTNAHIVINKKNKKPFKKLYIILKPDQVTGNFKRDTSRIYSSRLLTYSSKMDLALVKIEPKPATIFRPINFADSSLVSIGDPVLAIGHPENGGLWSLTTGTIGSKINNFQEIIGKNVFQTETSLNRGNSGGPLIDKNGRLIGINSNFSRINKEGLPVIGINFSIMSNVAAKWINSLDYDIDLTSKKETKKASVFQEANIVPVPDISFKKSDIVSQTKKQDQIIPLKKFKISKKEKNKLFENDLEKMMSLMREKINDKKLLSKKR